MAISVRPYIHETCTQGLQEISGGTVAFFEGNFNTGSGFRFIPPVYWNPAAKRTKQQARWDFFKGCIVMYDISHEYREGAYFLYTESLKRLISEIKAMEVPGLGLAIEDVCAWLNYLSDEFSPYDEDPHRSSGYNL